MILNMMDYITGPAGGYLAGTHDMITRTYPTRVVMIKSKPQGFPTDTWAIRTGKNGLGLYFFQTENGKANGWKDKTAFQLNVGKEPILCPLSVSALPWKSSVSQPVENSYVGGLWDGKDNPLGDTWTEIDQPESVDHAGDVGRQDTLMVKYHWGQDREIYSLVKGFGTTVFKDGCGLVGWQHETLNSNGVYILAEPVSVFNKFVACATLPDPVFGFPAGWLP